MKILVVDDHVLIREALRGVLRELKGEATVIIEAPDSRQAMRQIEQNRDVELVLLDLGLPDRDGFEMLGELGVRYPTISVVVLSAYHDRDRVMKALDLGALGFIPKSAQREVMLSAFNLIFAGGIYVPPEILGRHEPAAGPGQAAPAPPNRRVMGPDLGLTERQIEVLALMMQGKSNKAICRVLDLAEPTVKIHVSAILKALKVANRTEAVIAAGALGFGPAAGPRIDSGLSASARFGGRASWALQEPVQRSPQRHRRHRLVHQLVTARARLAQPLRPGVAADEESRNCSAQRAAQALDGLDAGPPVCQSVIGNDQIGLPALLGQLRERGSARCAGHDTTAPALQDSSHAVENKRVVVDHHDQSCPLPDR